MKKRSTPYIYEPGKGLSGCVIPFPKAEYELTKAQAKILREQIEPINRYFRVLHARATRRKVLPKLLYEIEKVQNGLHCLNIHLHYEASGWGPKDDPVQPPESEISD